MWMACKADGEETKGYRVLCRAGSGKDRVEGAHVGVRAPGGNPALQGVGNVRCRWMEVIRTCRLFVSAVHTGRCRCLMRCFIALHLVPIFSAGCRTTFEWARRDVTPAVHARDTPETSKFFFFKQKTAYEIQV